MSERPGSTGRRKLALVAAVFAVPLVFAIFLYFGGESLQPTARSNHGALLEPIVNVHESLNSSVRSSAFSDAAKDHWVLLYSNEQVCEEDCRDALYTLRQSRLMLGNDMSRLVRVFLHGESPPDTVFIEQQHAGLIALQDRELSRFLASRRPSQLAPGGYFLVDPLGNLVMYFPADIVPGRMVDDIEHLLELSRIG
ncbi:MAG TPA: hypothetical protein VF389_07455 [Woeseiaceae bacterium]